MLIQEDTPDAELLAIFELRRDPQAFEEIVRRHGPLVIATARKLLAERVDVEDAYQSTFLALATARLRRKGALAAWLHQTAIRCARAIRRANCDWDRKVRRNLDHAKNETTTVDDDTMAVLHQEVAKLPSKYRLAIVLCDLEGLTRQQAASRLGIATRTVSNHVIKARELLSSRLTRRGVTFSVSVLMAHAVAATLASAEASASLTAATTSKALLFAAGKSVPEVGVSELVFRTANKQARALTITKWTTLSVIIASTGMTVGIIAEIAGDRVSTANAATIFRDDFDGTSGVTWTHLPGFDSGTFDMSTGDFVITTPDGAPQLVGALDHVLEDVSIRALVRVSNRDTYGPSVVARGSLKDATAYMAGVAAPTGHAFIQQNLPEPNVIARERIDFNPLDEDIWIQFDLIGDQLSLFVWRPGETRPVAPAVSVTDDAFEKGIVAIHISSPVADHSHVGIVRSIHVADRPITSTQ